MTQWEFTGIGPDDRKLCAQFVDALPVTGAAISVFASSITETAICASDAIAARLDELQFDLGEGPRWEASRSRAPVLVPRVRHDAQPLWPVFATELRELEVEALFVFPLSVGAVDIGVVELYCAVPGALSMSAQSIAAVLANKTAWNLIGQLLAMEQEAQGDSPPESSPLSRREIHQATGMVLVQAETTATEALLLMRGHAFMHGRTVRDVASDVVARRIDFTSGPS